MPGRSAKNSRLKPSPGSLAGEANLGPKSAAVLEKVGVANIEQLRKLGAVRAYALAKSADSGVTLNLLWALEGALLGETWQSVAKNHRASLLLALEDYEHHRARQ